MTEPSKTPRTDAEYREHGYMWTRSRDGHDADCDMVPMYFAQQLERELAYAISKDHEAIAADRVVERAIGRQEGAAEANPNADWMTEAHTLCTDWGIGHGRLTERIKALRLKLERERDSLSEGSSFSLAQRTAETLDAERYRYLRNAAGMSEDGPSICSGLSDLFEYHFGPEVDEVVDEAIAHWKAAGCPLPKEVSK